MNIEDIILWAKQRQLGYKKDIFLPYAIIALWAIIGTQLAGIFIKIILIYIIFSLAVGFVTFILTIGATKYLVDFIKERECKIEDTWSRFKDSKDLGLTYLIYTGIIFAYTLLLIVPGVIKALSYSLVPYILMDENNNLKGMDVLKKSEEIMNGHKMELFKILLGYLPKHLLACLTLGILEIWILPEQILVLTKYLNTLKENAYGVNTIQQVQVQQPVTTIKYCKACGTQVLSNIEICPNCNSKID